MFLIKNLHCLKDRPVEVKNKIFNRLFSTAEVCNLNEFEFMKYSRSLKDYRDWHNTLNHAIEKETAKISRKLRAKYRKESREEGRKEGLAEGRAEGLAEGLAEGRAEGRAEDARNFLALGVDPEIISKATGISIEELQNL